MGESLSEFQKQFEFEELHPALAPYLAVTPSGLVILNHPLVQNLFHNDHMNRMMNQTYYKKMKLVGEAMKKGDWDTYIFLHERPYRAQALREVMSKIPPDQYWPLIRSVWIDTENLWQWGALKRTLLLAKKPLRRLLMNEAEREVLNGMQEVTPLIFRGFSPPGKAKGWSWTFDRTKAEWFAKRFAEKGTGHVAIGEVYTKDIIAYFESRNEWEVVVEPSKVNIMEVVPA